jgi:hypothetical protein
MSPPRFNNSRTRFNKNRISPGSPAVTNCREEREELAEFLGRICESIEKCELRTKGQLKQEVLELEWKKVAYVCDRLLFWIFLICTIVSTTLILSSSPYGPTMAETMPGSGGEGQGQGQDHT